MKIIAENEKEKAKRLADQERERQEQIRIAEEHNRRLDEQERKRAEEWAAREARIQNAMGRMADTVLKKSNQAEKELERRVQRYAELAHKKAEDELARKKEAARKRDQEIMKTLEHQLSEKKRQRELEQEANRAYVKQVIERDEREKTELKDKERKRFEMLRELQRYQQVQAGEIVHEFSDAQSRGLTSLHKRHKQSKLQLGGPMN